MAKFNGETQISLKSANSTPASIEPFATLRNRRLLMPSGNPGFFLIEKHFAGHLLEKLISSVHVDEKWYQTKYPDLAEVSAKGPIKSLKEHYVKFGYYEGRIPYQIDVDATWYLTQYPDIRSAIHRQEFASAQEHFELEGYREGRLPFAGFLLLTEAPVAPLPKGRASTTFQGSRQRLE